MTLLVNSAGSRRCLPSHQLRCAINRTTLQADLAVYPSCSSSAQKPLLYGPNGPVTTTRNGSRTYMIVSFCVELLLQTGQIEIMMCERGPRSTRLARFSSTRTPTAGSPSVGPPRHDMTLRYDSQVDRR